MSEKRGLLITVLLVVLALVGTLGLALDNTAALAKYQEDLKAVSDFVATAGTLLGFLVAIPLVALLLYKIAQLAMRSPEVVFSTFANSSGFVPLDARLTGFSQLARQGLVRDVKFVRRQMRGHFERIRQLGERQYFIPEFNAALPTSTPDQRLSDLTKSIVESGPDQVQFVVQLINLLFPPRGPRWPVACYTRANCP